MTNICEYGCGREAAFFFEKVKKYCCSSHYRKCPHQALSIGAKRIGKTHSDETKAKIGKASKERIARNGHPSKGVPLSEERKQHQSEVMKGKPGWSKGLTSKTNDTLRKMTERKKAHPELYSHSGPSNGMYGKTHTAEVKQRQRDKNIAERKWVGENNYWHGKSRSKELSPRYLPEKDRRSWETYKGQARYWTEMEYRAHADIINPNHYTRGLREYHIDHIIPLWYGFINGIDPKLLSKKENLRMLWCIDNQRRRKDKLDEDGKRILTSVVQYTEEQL